MIINLEENDSIMIKARNGYVRMFVDESGDLHISPTKGVEIQT